MSSVDLRISGRLYRSLPRWHADRLKRLITSKQIRTLDAVDTEIANMCNVDNRVKVLSEKTIEIDGAVFAFKRKSADAVREAIADGTFNHKPPGPGHFSGWYTGEEAEEALKIMWIKTPKSGKTDFSAYSRATSEQKAAMQVQIDELLGRDLFPDSQKFRRNHPGISGEFEL